MYQCHLTKFCILRPLTSKRAAEVAFQLLDIFLLFGAPCILQSDNGSEFTAQVISELKDLWPQLHLVHGKPRHPQSQGSVERANADIKDIFAAWLSDNNTQDWSLGLRLFQNQKNSAYHAGIKCTPYSAMFGCEAKVGLITTSLPQEIIEHLETEADLLSVLGQPSTPPEELPSTSSDVPPLMNLDDTPTEQHMASSDGPTTLLVDQEPAAFVESPPPVQMQPAESTAPANSVGSPLPPQLTMASSISLEVHSSPPALSPAPHTVVASHQSSITVQRKRAQETLASQAEHMVKRSRITLQAGDEGDNVAIPVPMVDRGRGDPHNILGVIINRDDNDLYTIAVKQGLLKNKFTRNEFTICQQRLLTNSDVNTDDRISVHVALKKGPSGGQGFARCNCLSSG